MGWVACTSLELREEGAVSARRTGGGSSGLSGGGVATGGT